MQAWNFSFGDEEKGRTYEPQFIHFNTFRGWKRKWRSFASTRREISKLFRITSQTTRFCKWRTQSRQNRTRVFSILFLRNLQTIFFTLATDKSTERFRALANSICDLFSKIFREVFRESIPSRCRYSNFAKAYRRSTRMLWAFGWCNALFLFRLFPSENSSRYLYGFAWPSIIKKTYKLT